ncbi:hypothetical protein D3C85_1079090 [compost metagenome]
MRATAADQHFLSVCLGTLQRFGDGQCSQLKQRCLYILGGEGRQLREVLHQPWQVEHFPAGALRTLGHEEWIAEQRLQ